MNVTQRISEQNIVTCPQDVVRINDKVLKGFHVRLGKLKSDNTRLASYYFFYRIGGRNGRQVNYFIGNSHNMDAGLARRIALQIEPHVKAGKDIQKMKFEAEKEAVKFKDFWRFCGEQFVEQKYKNSHDIIGQFKRHIIPQIGSIDLRKLSQRIIDLRIVSPLVQHNKHSSARQLISILKQLLEHAVTLHYLDRQPIESFEQLKRHPAQLKNQDLSMRLTGAQIKGVYYRASKSSKTSVYLFTLRLQILSGQSLAVICRTYRQDIKVNKWLLRDTNGKLSGKAIPLIGPLKSLLKQGVKDYTNAQSLFLIPGKGKRGAQDRAMDPKSLAKLQQQFIIDVHGHKRTMSQLLSDIEQAMLAVNVAPLVVGYLFHKKLESYLNLAPDDPIISAGLTTWYSG